MDRIGGVIVSGLTSSAVDRVFEPPVDSKQRLIKLAFICSFSANRTALKSKNKNWLARMSPSRATCLSARGLLFPWSSTKQCIKIQLSVCFVYLVQSGHHHYHCKVNQISYFVVFCKTNIQVLIIFGIIKLLWPSYEVNIKLSTLERLFSLRLKTSGKTATLWCPPHRNAIIVYCWFDLPVFLLMFESLWP